MANISPADVKHLREATNAGILDCKKALDATQGDVEKAKDWLRTKGLAAAAKKTSNIAAEGVVGINIDKAEKEGIVFELNSQTDFVARNVVFQEMAHVIGELALTHRADAQVLEALPYPGKSHSVKEEIIEKIAIIGENICLRRTDFLKVQKEGVVVGYVHNAVTPTQGKIGVLTALESAANKDQLKELGKKLAMHIAAARPLFLTREEVPVEMLEKERSLLKEEARNSGKSEEVVAKVAEGRIRKFYEEIVLLDQLYILDQKVSIATLLKESEANLGNPVQITGYLRYNVGEGIEKKEVNFAEEVAAVANRK